MYKVFKDDDGNFYTMEELRALFAEFKEEDETFAEWLNNATSKNGSLSGVDIDDACADDLAFWLSCHTSKTYREIFNGLTSGAEAFIRWLYDLEDDEESDASTFSKIWDVREFAEAKAHFLKSM